MNLCRIGLIEDKLFRYVSETETTIVACTDFKVGNFNVVATMNVRKDVWESAVEDYIYSEHNAKFIEKVEKQHKKQHKKQ